MSGHIKIKIILNLKKFLIIICKEYFIKMQLRVSDLLNDLHERTDLVEDRIEGIESKISQIQKNIESLPDLIGIDFHLTLEPRDQS